MLFLRAYTMCTVKLNWLYFVMVRLTMEDNTDTVSHKRPIVRYYNMYTLPKYTMSQLRMLSNVR